MSTTVTRYWPNVVAPVAELLGITQADALSYWSRNADAVYRIWRYVQENPGVSEADVIEAATGTAPDGMRPRALSGIDAEMIHRALVLGDMVSKMQNTGATLPPIAIESMT